ncbi:MAG: hypothetical protein HC915_02510 [Anaerolineae bacterium]|nr:hypothetical protein [Anaerolineae bacterium]
MIARTLGDVQAGLLSATFYTLVPYAFFFERMALADAWAGLIATGMVWVAIRFARRPTWRTAFWVGVFMALTPAAKLTMAFMAAIPAPAVLLLGRYRSLSDLWRRYGLRSFFALLVTALLWMLVLVPAVIENLSGGPDYILFDNHLVGVATESQTLGEKLGEWWEKQALLMSVPLTVFWLVAWPFALLQQPRRLGLLLSWLALAWFATFFVIAPGSFQSRYLMAGFPAVAVTLGVGGLVLLRVVTEQLAHSQARALAWGGFVLALVFWAAGFALPFAQQASTDPAALHLPPQDEKRLPGRLVQWLRFAGCRPISERPGRQRNALHHQQHALLPAHRILCAGPVGV